MSFAVCGCCSIYALPCIARLKYRCTWEIGNKPGTGEGAKQRKVKWRMGKEAWKMIAKIRCNEPLHVQTGDAMAGSAHIGIFLHAV